MLCLLYSVNSLIVEYLLLEVAGRVATPVPSLNGLAFGKQFFRIASIRGVKTSTSSVAFKTSKLRCKGRKIHPRGLWVVASKNLRTLLNCSMDRVESTSNVK